MQNAQPISPTLTPPWSTLARELLVLALPIIGMTVTRLLMIFVDFVMVSQLGTEAQAAVSPASLLVFAIAAVGAGVAQAIQTYVAQVDGRGESRLAGGYAWQCLYLAAASIVVVFPLSVTTDAWFAWFVRVGQHTPAVAALEVDYIRIALWFVPAAVVSYGLDGFYSGVRRPGISLAAALVALAANIVGNWLLIFGANIGLPAISLPLLGTIPAWNIGIPALGIAGAAIATVVAWTLRAAVLWVALFRPAFDERFQTRRSYRVNWKHIRGLLRVGGPTSLQWIIDLGSWIVFMALIMPPFGEQAMAATGIGMQLMHFSFMPAVGVGIALCSQVGFAIGQGRPDEAMRRTRVALAVTTLYMGVAGLVFLLGRREFIWLLNEDPGVIQAGSWVLIWAAIFQIFDAMGITFINALRGAGDTRWPTAVALVLCWGVFVGGGYLVSQTWPQFGLNGPWATCTTYIVLLGLMLAWRWRCGAWRKIKLFESSSESVDQNMDRPATVTEASAGGANGR
jgi:MATE family multidrug resistance protein